MIRTLIIYKNGERNTTRKITGEFEYNLVESLLVFTIYNEGLEGKSIKTELIYSALDYNFEIWYEDLS
jgi:hypothetical protein